MKLKINIKKLVIKKLILVWIFIVIISNKFYYNFKLIFNLIFWDLIVKIIFISIFKFNTFYIIYLYLIFNNI